MRLFLISLGVTCLVCVVLFLYFRNRIGRMEQKVGAKEVKAHHNPIGLKNEIV